MVIHSGESARMGVPVTTRPMIGLDSWVRELAWVMGLIFLTGTVGTVWEGLARQGEHTPLSWLPECWK